MDKKLENQNLEERRSFIKKAVYAAPALIALGSITRPVVAAAASCGVYSECLESTENSGSTTTTNSDSGNNDEGGFQGGF